MGAAGSVVADSDPDPGPESETLLTALSGATFPDATETDARIGAAAMRRTIQQVAAAASLASKSTVAGSTSSKSRQHSQRLRPLPPASPDLAPAPPLANESLAAGQTVTPALSMVGVRDLSRLLAPPPPFLRFEDRVGVLPEALRRAVGDSLGLYKLVDGLALRGRPVWRHVSASDR